MSAQVAAAMAYQKGLEEGRAQIADLLAVAECHQAISNPGDEAARVLERHGWDPSTECCDTFLQRITKSAIAKAKVAP